MQFKWDLFFRNSQQCIRRPLGPREGGIRRTFFKETFGSGASECYWNTSQEIKPSLNSYESSNIGSIHHSGLKIPRKVTFFSKTRLKRISIYKRERLIKMIENSNYVTKITLFFCKNGRILRILTTGNFLRNDRKRWMLEKKVSPRSAERRNETILIHFRTLYSASILLSHVCFSSFVPSDEVGIV